MKQQKLMLGLVALVAILALTTPAHALFTNGGFEDGNFNGWDVTFGNVYTANTNAPSWTGFYAGSRPYTPSAYPYPQIVTSSTTNPGQTLDVNPYNGTYMAQINNIVGNWDATRLSQAATVAAGDINDTLYINWGAMLVNPGGHGALDQPYFHIDVQRNGSVVNSFSANGIDAATPGSGWTVAGAQPGTGELLWYRADQFTYDLSTANGWNIGDILTVSMFVADCGLGGHGGYAFLDGIGTEYVPPPSVPEPSSMLLLGAGLLGAGIMRKKFGL